MHASPLPPPAQVREVEKRGRRPRRRFSVAMRFSSVGSLLCVIAALSHQTDQLPRRLSVKLTGTIDARELLVESKVKSFE
jgi:hypothetical protein